MFPNHKKENGNIFIVFATCCFWLQRDKIAKGSLFMLNVTKKICGLRFAVWLFYHNYIVSGRVMLHPEKNRVYFATPKSIAVNIHKKRVANRNGCSSARTTLKTHTMIPINFQTVKAIKIPGPTSFLRKYLEFQPFWSAAFQISAHLRVARKVNKPVSCLLQNLPVYVIIILL